MDSEINWDEKYQTAPGQLPWDTGTPSPDLVEYFESLDNSPGQVLEIGCGTGTNAIWMAKNGSTVIATDISPTAIAEAKKKQNQEGIEVDFRVGNILEELPLGDASLDLVFDRGVYHVMAPDDRKTFINAVAKMLRPNGYWLCIAGNADDKSNPEEEGPPRLKASEVVELAEEKFEIHSLTRTCFILPDGIKKLAWKVLYLKR